MLWNNRVRMEKSTPKRRLNLSGLTSDAGSNASNAISRYHVIGPRAVNNDQSDSKENTQVPVIASISTTSPRTSEAPHFQQVTVAGPKSILAATSSTLRLAAPNSPRKFRYATIGTNSLKRPALHPEVSVTSSVTTQTDAPSYLQENRADLYAVCKWCGSLSQDFTSCVRCKRAIGENPKIYTPPPLHRPGIQGTPTTQTITTIIAHQPIVLTPQQAAAVLVPSSAAHFYGQSITMPQTTYLTHIPNGPKIMLLEKPPPAKRGRKKKAEPECLTISSDEEEKEDVPFRSTEGSEANDSVNSSSLNSDLPLNGTTECQQDSGQGRVPVIQVVTKRESQDSPGSPNSSSSSNESASLSADLGPDPLEIVLKCRSIRVGSYKVQADEKHTLIVKVTCKEIYFELANLLGDKLAAISLQHKDIPSVLAHFGKALPVLFIYTTPGCGGTIRNQLSMTIKDKTYYDPCHPNETMKRITILPVSISEQQKQFLLTKFPGDLIKEIRQSVANEVLVKSTPSFVGPQKTGYTVETRSQVLQQLQQQAKLVKDVVKLVTYPAPPQTGGIEITSEDLDCLKEGEFLNDVIIDFYLKFLVNERLSPEDRKRTHIFSSFFFPRLIMKNPDEDTSVSIVKRRHNRVKTWTRHVDIFEKDFVVVPINQNSHWFLAVICFPGRVQSGAAPELPQETTPKEQQQGEECEPPGINSLPPPGDDSMMDSPVAFPNNLENMDDPECPFPPTPPVCPLLVPVPGIEDMDTIPAPPLASLKATPSATAMAAASSIEAKEPCILMFDSLPGNSHWKIVRTLREYLAMELESKKKCVSDFNQMTMKGLNVCNLPRQDNYSDCGIYLLQYVESFFENPLKHFCVPLPNLTDWFEEFKITGKREELKELILSLKSQQQETNSAKDKLLQDKSASIAKDVNNKNTSNLNATV